MIYDHRFVTTETVIVEQFIANPENVAAFVRLHGLIRKRAQYGQGALESVKRVIEYFSRDTSAPRRRNLHGEPAFFGRMYLYFRKHNPTEPMTSKVWYKESKPGIVRWFEDI